MPRAVSFFGGDPISLRDVSLKNVRFKFTDTPVIQDEKPTNKKIIEIEGLPNNLKEIINANYIYSGGSSFIFNLSFSGLPTQELSLVLGYNENELILKLSSEPLIPEIGDPERFQIRHALKLIPSKP